MNKEELDIFDQKVHDDIDILNIEYNKPEHKGDRIESYKFELMCTVKTKRTETKEELEKFIDQLMEERAKFNAKIKVYQDIIKDMSLK